MQKFVSIFIIFSLKLDFYFLFQVDLKYIQEATVHLDSETHGGEDVPVYASGPMSHLFEGTFEQSYIAHAMAYSGCIGPYANKECLKDRSFGINKAYLLNCLSLNIFILPVLSLLLIKIHLL